MTGTSALTAEPAAIARALGATFVAGPAVVAVWLLLPHPGAVDVVAVAVVCAAGALFGAALAAGVLDTAPRGAFHLSTAVSSLMVSVAIYFTHSPASGFGFLFLWATPYAFLFFSSWAAYLHVALMGLGYSAALAIQVAHGDVAAEQQAHLPARVLLCTGTVLVVGTLVRRLVSVVREQDLRWSTSFDQSPFGTALISPDGRYRLVNDALCRLLERGRDELVGTDATAHVHPDDRQLAAAAHDRPGATTYRLIRSGGGAVFAAVTAHRVMPDDGAPYLLAQYEDVTARTEAIAAATRRERRQTAILELSAYALGDPGLECVLERAKSAIRSVTGAASVTVVDVTPDDGGDGRHAAALQTHGHVLERQSSTAPTRVLAALGVRHRLFGALAVTWDDAGDVSGGTIGFVMTVAGIVASAMERRRHDDELAHRAMHDTLTGLPNRVLARDRLELTIHRRRRDGRCAACILVDADDFKLVNEALGHDVGDELLTVLAPRLVEAVGRAHTVARLGGDEFLVIADDLSGPHEAAELAGRLLADIARPVVLRGLEHHVTACAGVVLIDGDTGDAEGLLQDADAALYRAKARGRGRVELFDDGLRNRVVSRMQLQQELRRGLERGELVVHYQPIVGLLDAGLRSVEALVRWQHPTRGLLGPGDFIAVAEESGLIVPLGQQVLEQACRQLARWQRSSPELRVCVNVAPEQLADGDFATFVAGVIRRAGIAPETLALEITERTIIDGAADADGQLARLRQLGVLLVLDDFGTGYSSLSYLRRFPVDVLKIDRTFVAALDRDPQDEAIVRTVIDLAHTLGLSVVAEGVERAEQVRVLAGLGCDRAQGFHLGRPGPPQDLEAWLQPAAAFEVA